jgi:hypothetical protein
LFDLSGKKIATQEIVSASLVGDINTKNLVKGFYLIKLSAGKQSFNQKFLKQ